MILQPYLLDVLRGRVTPDDFLVASGVPRREMARLLSEAEVFDFGGLHLEPSERGLPAYDVPRLTDEEEGFFAEGLIPLPAPVTAFEFQVAGHPRYLILVVDGEEGWEATRMEDGLITGTWIRKTPDDDPTAHFVWGPPSTEPKDLEKVTYGANLGMAKYFSLMISSKTTEVRRVEGGPREGSNRHPLPAHRVVTIVPTRFRTDGDAGGTHASPRLHWRRSHLREYKAPSGEVYNRVVIPRHLVGRADLGEVSHEYRVKS